MNKRILLLLSVLIFTLIFITACDIPDNFSEPEIKEDVKILLTVGDGIEIIGDSSYTVPAGDEVLFKVKFASGDK